MDFILILEQYILLLTQTARKSWTIFSIQILPRYTWFQLVWQVRICNFLASSYSCICKWEVTINVGKNPQQNRTCSVIEWCLFSGYLPWPLIKQALWRVVCMKLHWVINNSVCEQSSLENPRACFFSCKFVKWKM